MAMAHQGEVQGAGGRRGEWPALWQIVSDSDARKCSDDQLKVSRR